MQTVRSKKNREKKTGKTFSKQIETILYKSSILLLVLHVESCRRLKPFHTVADDDVTNQGLTPSLNVVLSETYFIWSACVLTRIRGVETTQNPPRCYICLIRQVWFKPGAKVSAVTPCSSCVCYGQWMQRIVIKLTNYLNYFHLYTGSACKLSFKSHWLHLTVRAVLLLCTGYIVHCLYCVLVALVNLLLKKMMMMMRGSIILNRFSWYSASWIMGGRTTWAIDRLPVSDPWSYPVPFPE